MKTLTLKISETLLSRLDESARRGRETRSAVIRRAIDRYLSARRASMGGSVLAVAKDLAGIVEGPSDLSVNGAHMRGYGK